MLGVGVNRLRRKGRRSSSMEHAAILVVDDDPDVIDVVGLMLQHLGHDVTEVGNGHAAPEVFAESRHDPVICDVGMPDMSGYDVAKAIKTMSPERGHASYV